MFAKLLLKEKKVAVVFLTVYIEKKIFIVYSFMQNLKWILYSPFFAEKNSI